MSERLVFAVAVIFVLLACHAQADEPALMPAKTRAVVIGVLHWDDPSPTTYSASQRKDLELYDALVTLGVPKANRALLMDEEATLANCNSAIRRIAKSGPAGDTLIVYYAGHGTANGRGVCLLNYDVKPGKTAETSIVSSKIVEVIKDEFHGERVLPDEFRLAAATKHTDHQSLNNQGEHRE